MERGCYQMNKLFDYAQRYIKGMSVRDMAALKFCLCAVGTMIGLAVPKKRKKPALIMAAGVFLVTYIPLMAKFLGGLAKEEYK